VKKRYILAAASLDVLGAGILLYGYGRELSVKDNIDGMLWTAAEKSAKQRDTAYTLGLIILLSGVSIHIFF
jgi:1,2-phenylacetyl-CoA epoxidase catalytic subunit